MRCYICNKEGASRKNLVLDHQHITEIYRCVCNECLEKCNNGENNRFY